MTHLRRPNILAVVLVALGISVGPAHAAAKDLKKLDTALLAALGANDAKPKLVIVRVKPGALQKTVSKMAGQGKVIRTQHNLIEAFSTSMTAQEAVALATTNDDVLDVTEDAVVEATATPTAVQTSLSSAVGATLPGGVPYTGAGRGVAVVDSGIGDTLDLRGRISAFYDFTNGKVQKTGPKDEYGHGTFIAGVIASSGQASDGEFPGLAPGVRLIGLRVLDGKGQGLTSDVINALEFAVVNKSALGIDVINLSLGHPITQSAFHDPLVLATERAARSGIIVVVSAGNFGKRADGTIGYAGISSPGNAPSAITVGAVKTFGTTAFDDDRVADFSSRGPSWIDLFAKPDLVAPGHKLVSSGGDSALYVKFESTRYEAQNKRHMLMLSGSSVSAAVVSGVAALMLDANRTAHPGTPALSPNAVKAILEFTAVPVKNQSGIAYDVLTQGAGALNALGAITVAAAVNTAAPIGTSWVTSPLNPVTLRLTDALLWGQRIIWGDSWLLEAYRIIWGNTVYWSSGLRWGASLPGTDIGSDAAGGTTSDSVKDGIAWSSNILWGNAVVWGSTSVGITDGTNILWGNVAWGSVMPSSLVWGPLSGHSLVGLAVLPSDAR